MASTYVNDLRLEEMATGDQSGTWGDTTNTNLELIAEAFSYGTQASFGSDADATTTIADGATDPVRSLYLKVTSGVSLTATRTLTIAPNTVSKIWIIENATSGSQSINISQGSGANVTIPNGDVKVIYTDGAGAGAAVVDAFTDLNLSGTTTVAALDAGSGAITTTGTVTGNTLAGTLSTAAQPNITSLGTLTGLDVAGTPTFDGLTVDGTATFNTGTGTTNNFVITGTNDGGSTAPDLVLFRDSASPVDGDNIGMLLFKGNNDAGTSIGYAGIFATINDASSTTEDGKLNFSVATANTESPSGGTTFMTIEGGGDISFYEDTGTTAKFFWDASAENLNIGDMPSVPTTAPLNLRSNSDSHALTIYEPVGANENWQLGVDVDGDLGFYNSSNTTASVTFDDSGNVGIGTSSPISAANYANLTLNGSSGGQIHFADDDVKKATIQSAANDLYVQSGSQTIFRNGGFTSGDEAMRIDSSGNVGIGTSSPSDYSFNTGVDLVVGDGNNNAISIVSSTSGLGYLAFADGTTGTERYQGLIEYSHASNYMALRTSGSEAMRIDSSGNVGIGTATPSFGSGSGLEIQRTSADATLRLEHTGANGFEITAQSGQVTYNSLSSKPHVFEIANTERMRIDSSGNVGIGTTNPSTGKLVIDADNNAVGLRLNGGTTTGQSFGSRIRAGTNSSDYGLLVEDTSANVILKVTGDGNVGIGNTSPLGKLTISNAAGANAPTTVTAANTYLQLGSDDYGASNNGKFMIGFGYTDATNTNSPAYIGYEETSSSGDTKGELTFYTRDVITDTAPTERMRIDSSGNLLVGKTSAGLSATGTEIYSTGEIGMTRSGSEILNINRLSNDGQLVRFFQDTSLEGDISVSGATVSYNGFSGNHETSGISTDTEIGTVCSTIDELDVYVSGTKEGQTRTNHAKIKVSDTVGDTRVYGVLANYSENDNKPIVASVGIGSVKVTGACRGGDLLESNGDGTAKVQSDDIVRSKTIGKVTIGNSDTGVKLVSCVLYCG